MEETLINFLTAKLAKQAGFDEKVEFCFIEGHGDQMFPVGNEYHSIEGTTFCNFNKDDGCYSICTLSFLQQWLREVHDLDIVPVRVKPDHVNRIIYLNGYEWYNNKGLYIVESSYEEALEKGLSAGLKVILKEKNK